ncbi:hypothetical protein C8A03DRAFT_33492 [Achaetomium macrosporum]|uniref:Uncharacterized protein n=1 Tax=Achaetomium macrosporum TaxID=79813 RepID=A0AAN7H7A5_9PEZI|nr:hypothetical protein C8A03DRAFT_33492 [Achaetomium macrosporum]
MQPTDDDFLAHALWETGDSSIDPELDLDINSDIGPVLDGVVTLDSDNDADDDDSSDDSIESVPDLESYPDNDIDGDLGVDTNCIPSADIDYQYRYRHPERHRYAAANGPTTDINDGDSCGNNINLDIDANMDYDSDFDLDFDLDVNADKHTGNTPRVHPSQQPDQHQDQPVSMDTHLAAFDERLLRRFFSDYNKGTRSTANGHRRHQTRTRTELRYRLGKKSRTLKVKSTVAY